LAFGRNHGAALSVLGAKAPPSGRLVGDSPWTRLQVELEVVSEKEIELVCDLRASAGHAWFDTNSLRLVQLPHSSDPR